MGLEWPFHNTFHLRSLLPLTKGLYFENPIQHPLLLIRGTWVVPLTIKMKRLSLAPCGCQIRLLAHGWQGLHTIRGIHLKPCITHHLQDFTMPLPQAIQLALPWQVLDRNSITQLPTSQGDACSQSFVFQPCDFVLLGNPVKKLQGVFSSRCASTGGQSPKPTGCLPKTKRCGE